MAASAAARVSRAVSSAEKQLLALVKDRGNGLACHRELLKRQGLSRLLELHLRLLDQAGATLCLVLVFALTALPE